MNKNKKEIRMKKVAEGMGIAVAAVMAYGLMVIAGCGGTPPEDAAETKTGAIVTDWTCNPPSSPIYSDPLYPGPCWRGLPWCNAPNHTGTYLQPIQDIQMGSEGIMAEPNRIWVNVPGRGVFLAQQDPTQSNDNGTPVSRAQFYGGLTKNPAVSDPNWGIVNILQGRTTGSCRGRHNQFSMACWDKISGSNDIPLSYTAVTGYDAVHGIWLNPPAGPIADPWQFQGAQGYWKNSKDVVCQAYGYIGPTGGTGEDLASNWWPIQFGIPPGRITWFETSEGGRQCYFPTGTSLDHTHLNAQLQNIPYIPATDTIDLLEFSASYTMNCTP
jgi:hypothetical protein